MASDGGSSGSVPAAWHQHSGTGYSSHANSYLKPFIEHQEREEELERARQCASLRFSPSQLWTLPPVVMFLLKRDSVL